MKLKRKILKKILAVMMSVLMVMTLLPTSTMTVQAATEEHPNTVTITVKDEEGTAIEDAAVSFVIDSKSKGSSWKTGSGVTDSNGCIVVLSNSDFIENDLTITATITKEHYEKNETISNTDITSSDENIDVCLKSTLITDVDIEGKTLTYNGHAQELVSVTEIDGDTIQYEYNESLGIVLNDDEKPVATNAGTYEVKVTVSRENMEDLVETVTTTIHQADIGVSMTAIENLKYNENNQTLVSITGSSYIPDGSTVQWYIGNDEYSTSIDNIPKASAVGQYTVKLIIKSGDSNYADSEITQVVQISKADLNTDGLNIEGVNSTYNGDSQDSLEVTYDDGYENTYTLQYQLSDIDDETYDDNAWENEIPAVTNAGTYKVWVKIVKKGYEAGYNPSIVSYCTNIAKASQAIVFDDETYTSDGTTTVTLEEANIYDFSASGGYTDNTMTYTIENGYQNNTDESNATISEEGEVTITGEGAFIITATRKGNSNYEDGIVKHVLVVTKNSNLVSFESSELSYILGQNKGIVSDQEANILNSDDNGTLTYSMDETRAYLSIDETTGQLTVTDYQALADAMEDADDMLTIVVTASKTAGIQNVVDLSDSSYSETEIYASATIAYTVTISFLDTPDQAYTIEETMNDNGWYKDAINILPADSDTYQIAKECYPDSFEDSITYSDEGTDSRYIYLRNTENGGITHRILLDNVKIDTMAPDENNMSIEIQELETINKSDVDYGFYNSEVTIKFIVADETEDIDSGIDYITWYYCKDSYATSSIASDISGNLNVTLEDGQYVASLTLTADEANQYRGHIAFTATDIAGNTSNKVTEDGTIIVVDTISPTMTTEFHVVDTTNGIYKKEVVDGVAQHYFNGDVNYTLTINEANFFSDDVCVTVTRNGSEIETHIDWNDDDEIHYGTFVLSGDGDYVVSVTYTDNSGNAMKSYTSEVMTIDTMDPVIDFTYNQTTQKTTFTVIEPNFRASGIVVTGTVTDINGQTVAMTSADIEELLHNGTWNEDGDTYTFEIDDQYVDGIYDLTIDYVDLLNNEAKTIEPDIFVIDHTAPTDISITYSTSIVDTVLKTLTLGFYNPDVTVTMTAYDTISGVENFTWNYTKQEGQSDINRSSDGADTISKQVITASQDATDKSKFTAQITLTASEAEQLRGYISVIATDNYDNISDKITDDGYILVVDTISPTMNVEYNQPTRSVGTRDYYNDDITVTFNINEANFFSEDVHVSISKDGGNPYTIYPSWSDISVDEHVGTYTISGDGDYIIYVDYTDRSTNEMTSYTSHTMTIDTIAPVIDVQYKNNNCINTLIDSDGHSRQYYDTTQSATITITEHNFNANEVDFSIIAKDVTGNTLDASTLYSKSSWKVDSSGDVHTITITYPGDANYTFDVTYADMATNEAKDYAADYFTVDKTGPTNLKISYSTSVLDTVLESLTFGFYNAKMKVTISADDNISGVHSFMYSYLNADGVSSVNAQLTNQTITAKNITYTNSGKTATATFEIPKSALKSNNQFNGTITMSATDRTNNTTNKSDSKRIVVDNISPTATVTYNNATNTANGISYYNGQINATITINEANFYASDVHVMVSKDGGTASAASVSWSNNSVDEHIGTFTLTGDGDYIVTITYADKSSNQMVTYTSNQMTIDTDIVAPTFSINGDAKTENGGAYKGDVTIGFNYEDQNLDSVSIKLTRTRYDSVEDVTDEFINVSTTDKGGSGSFDIPSIVENDGIYLLTISISDKANHTIESSMKFTINRYGSVYEYSDYLVSLIQDGGQYIKIEEGYETAITDDLIITEYNASQILEDSLQILITRDGQAIDATYTTQPVDDSGWYQYIYTINKDNFSEDGVYKITLSSAYSVSDSTNNESTSVPENSLDSSGNQILDTITFTVDTTAPEIRNIVNLDQAIINAQTLDVDYTIVDVGGLDKVEIIVNGETLETITEFGDSVFNYTGTFTLNESSSIQTIQLKVTDIAGNITDTASDDFTTGGLYIFNDKITLSTNFFVRWFANKPLFYGSIIAVLAIIAGFWFLIIGKRRKEEEETEQAE